MEYIEETIPPLRIKSTSAVLPAIKVGHYVGIGSSLTKGLLDFVLENHVVDMTGDSEDGFHFTPNSFRVYAAMVINLAKIFAQVKAREPGKEEEKRSLQIFGTYRDVILPRVVIETREKLGESPLAQQLHVESMYEIPNDA